MGYGCHSVPSAQYEQILRRYGRQGRYELTNMYKYIFKEETGFFKFQVVHILWI